MEGQTGGLKKPWSTLFGLGERGEHEPAADYLDDTINLEEAFKEFNVKTKNNIKKINN